MIYRGITMKHTKIIMGMPITIEIVDTVDPKVFEEAFNYFKNVDDKFSTYKEASEISRINRGEVVPSQFSSEMTHIFDLAEKTKAETNGYFDIKKPDQTLDPSGIVKGWAIYQVAEILNKRKIKNYYVEAGGDLQVSGRNHDGKKWRVGIKNPFVQNEIVKVLLVETQGVATSGTYIRGNHIYNPKTKKEATEIASLTVVGPNIYEADRFATAAFAMGLDGINFIEQLQGFEGYLIDKNGIGTATSGLLRYTKEQ